MQPGEVRCGAAKSDHAVKFVPTKNSRKQDIRVAERVFPGQPEVLRVIYCPFNEKDDRTFGITDGGIVSDWDFPKFCMINVRKANPDQGTMLHEMIHASRLEKREHDLDPSSVFSENIGARSRLTLEHAEALAHAFFAAVLQ